jgi:uncharacterized protein (DUF362 family)/NAD-dependent dihydropyrimidine dehydrogenase PreA subunit
VTIPDGKRLKKTPICNFLLNADKVIALPKIKTHSLMIMTLATKIMFGGVPGLTKARYHSRYIRRVSFADMLLDILSIIPPNLIIMDGIIGMQGEGPAGGIPVEIGVLMATEDAIAMDLSVCSLLDIEPIGIPVLKQAKLRGLWPKNIFYPILNSDDVKHEGFVLPASANYLLTGKKIPKQSPIITEKCTSCGFCQEICPKQVITKGINGVQINYSKCIRCYCCHEICPENAIVLKIDH